jgi:hypothetical protein
MGQVMMPLWHILLLCLGYEERPHHSVALKAMNGRKMIMILCAGEEIQTFQCASLERSSSVGDFGAVV